MRLPPGGAGAPAGADETRSQAPAAPAPAPDYEPLQSGGDVLMELAPRQQENTLYVEGRTNLPSGALIEVKLAFDGYTLGGFTTEWVRVKQGGCFKVKFQPIRGMASRRAWLTAEFDPTDSDQLGSILKHVGAKGERLTGELIRPEDGVQKVFQVVHVDVDGEMKATPMTRAPEHHPTAEDYIRDLAVRQDGRRIFVTGQTNLPHGSSVRLNYSARGWILVGTAERAYVEADGTFSGQLVVIPDIRQADLTISASFDPFQSRYDDRVLELYGEKGEKLAGEQVQGEADDGFFIAVETWIDYQAPEPNAS